MSLSLSRSQSSVKCYMADTGLLCALALANGATTAEELYRNVLLGNVSINEGMLVENFVVQTLASKGDKLFFYAQTSSKKGCERMEVDFLIVRPFADAGGKPRVVPIEVKSGNKYRTTSLDRFSQKFASKVGTEIVLHPGQLRKEGKRLFVPLYLTHLLCQINFRRSCGGAPKSKQQDQARKQEDSAIGLWTGRKVPVRDSCRVRGNIPR